MTTRPTPTEANGHGQFVPEYVSVDKLHLDSTNPRIQQVGVGLDQQRILELLWREYSVEESSVVHRAERLLPA